MRVIVITALLVEGRLMESVVYKVIYAVCAAGILFLLRCLWAFCTDSQGRCTASIIPGIKGKVRGKMAEVIEIPVARRESSKTAGHKTALVIAVSLSLLVLPSARTQDVPNSHASASSDANAPAATPLGTPSLSGPLQAAPPITFEGGPLGKLNLNGIVSGIGVWQGNHIPGDNPTQAAISNGQIFIQKTTDWWQFYVQAGAYNILALATPFLSTDKAISNLYGPVP